MKPGLAKGLRTAALALLALLLLLGGSTWWVWRSPTALDWALRQVPGLTLNGQQGRATGGPFAVQRLQWQGARQRVVVEGLAWDDARWSWHPHAGAWLGLRLVQARAARVQVTSDPAPRPAEPASPPPEQLRLPLELQAAGLRIGAVQLDQQPPITDIAADLHLGAANGSEHRVQALQLQRDGLSVSGQAVIGTGQGLPLNAQVQLAGLQQWQAALQATGPLQRLRIDTRLQHTAGASATAQATVAPFAAWPLLALAARAEQLDLSTLVAGLPQTELSGSATLTEPRSTQTSTDPLVLDIQLQNAQPGPWDAARLPVRSLHVLLQGRPSDPGTLVFDTLQAQLAGLRDGGVVTGTGRLQNGRLRLELQIDGVRPEQLHTQAPAMMLGGKVQADVSGLVGKPAPTRQADLRLDLTGRLPRAGAPPLTLQTTASATLPPDGTVLATLRDLQARAGDDANKAGNNGGSATAQATASRNAAGDWQLKTRGSLARFDPGPWWPAAKLGRDGQSVNGQWQADMQLLAGPTNNPLTALRGQASFTLAESRFANLVWRGQASLQAAAEALQAAADLQAGSNRFQLNGSLPHTRGTARQATPSTAAPNGTLDIQAPNLAALAPLADLLPAAAAAWWPREGALTARGSAQGQWPVVRSEGSLRASSLRSPRLSLNQAEAQWDLATGSPDAPLSLQLQATGLVSGQGTDQKRLDSLDATLQGSLRAHTLQLRAASPLRPPEWAEAVTGSVGPGGSTFAVQASGAWEPATAGGGSWRGRVAQLQAASRTAPATPWLASQNLQATVTLNADGQPQQAVLEPGRITAFGGALAWQQAQWQAATTPSGAPRIALQAQLEPLPVAPWLARLQPQFGWRGDLAVAGRIAVTSAERFDADISIERTAGDLSLTVEGATRQLDISDLRLGLSAHNGLWQVTQALVGRSVGVVGGLQTITTTAQAVVPPPEAPLQGGLSLIVPQLQVWAPWLPPGWRLGGNLRVAASFAGTTGKPEYRGSVTGENLAVRNLFEGILMEQGQLAVALQGTEATVERFEFRDGAAGSGATTGVLRVSGNGNFDGGLRAQLRVVAEKMRLVDRFDRRISASGNADVNLDTKGLKFGARGAFTVDEGLVDATQADAPKLSNDVVVRNRAPLASANPAAAAAAAAKPPNNSSGTASGTDPAPPPPGSAMAKADVDLRVDLGQQLRLRGRGLDTLLRGQLRVTTPGGQLAVNGAVRAEEGTYRAYGQNLRIERGNLIFRGNVATPQLDILALRADIDQRVGVVVSGSPVNPRVRLYSEPELGQLDTLTWLVLGRAPEGLGRDDTALLQRAALALLAGERGGDEGFLQKLGLDELSLSRANTGGVNDTIISLGKQISKRVYVGYEHALGAAGGTLQLIYRIANRITLRARTGSENAVDAIWTWRWN